MKRSKTSIEVVDHLPKAVEEAIHNGFSVHGQNHGIDVNYKKFVFVIKDDADEVLGVLNGYTVFAEIHVDDLWVAAPHRGKGYGKKLLATLEEHFRGKGFNNINLCTCAFQAPDFYKKCGFQEEFVRKNRQNPKLTQTFFVKYFLEDLESQGVLTAGNSTN